MFDSIDLDYSHALSVTWDVGRRCNLDCSYCPSYRHDNFSPFAGLEDLKKTGRFVFEYLDLYLKNRTNRVAKVDFTGGEPTINPNFAKFSQWLRQVHADEYEDNFNFQICLTSNGIINEKMRDNVLQNFDYATFSYHVESTKAQKDRFLNNMKYFKERKFDFKINVMFHAKPEFFQECLNLSEELKKLDIEFVPRLIGEKDNKDRYNHQYTPQQLQWMQDFWKNPGEVTFHLPEIKLASDSANTLPSKKEKQSGCSIGRPCCGNRKMHVASGEKQSTQTSFVDSVAFKDWYCSVNWFFLHIEQQTGEIFHHQTCQARFDYSRGPIGKLDATDQLLADLRSKMDKGNMPIIQCSKKTCACGLCAPKARSLKDLKNILPRHINTQVFETEDVFAAPSH